MNIIISIIILSPLLGFLVNTFFGKKIKNEKIMGFFSSFLVLISFSLSVYLLYFLLNSDENSRSFSVILVNWLNTGNFSVNFSYLIDPLSVVMSLVVTGVGFLIHVYSIGYMHDDSGYAEFFAYMNLFIFAMMNLVLSDNFLLLFLGWEGVGLCSYLLIGFWYKKKFTGDAAKKAFIVNRIGDFGFMTAMLLIFANFGTLGISDFISGISGFDVNNGLLTAIALLFFLGATGKSAQIPLFVWLPDAMAGPTPVSALIHAATMVTAGVYLVARTSLLFTLSPIATGVILWVGIFTALFAATIALKQNDIKKVLAYSTVSQLGFMFIALGTLSFVAAIFHLVTHAFFKALLFLGSGSVIHALKDEQDIRNMGGLKNSMKVTYITFLIGGLAISGIPPLSGFFSKDEILYQTFLNAGLLAYIITFITAGFTAFYIFRLIILTFYGKPRFDAGNIHPHESPVVMTLPLIILAVLSAAGGFIGLPHITGAPNLLSNWLEPVFRNSYSLLAEMNTVDTASVHGSVFIEAVLILSSVVLAAGVIYASVRHFIHKDKFETEKGFGRVLENKYYVDEFYQKALINPIHKTSDKLLWKFIDVKIIDGFLNSLADYLVKLSYEWKKIQSGIFQDYALISIAGVVLIILYLLFI